MVGSEWCVTNLTYGRWILIQSIFGINRRANLSQPSVLVPTAVVLSDHRHPHFRNLNFTVPVDAVRMK